MVKSQLSVKFELSLEVSWTIPGVRILPSVCPLSSLFLRTNFGQKRHKKSTPSQMVWKCLSCGDNGNRTHDLVNAIHALSQLSYIPIGPAVFSPLGLELS